MPLFEFDEGRLIPAQFGRSVHDGLSEDMLSSIREQVLEIVGRPLFPITWQDAAPVGSGMDGGTPRLTALDASGQVVSVEVLEALTSATMIDSLSRLADTASLGWNDLAGAYPGGIQGFRIGWAEFRDAMPPSPAPGPRLILVVGSIDDQVRPALDVLASSGVEVHEISVRVMSSGRKFLDVQAVGPRMYGHNPNLLLGNTPQIPQLTGSDVPSATRGAHAEAPASFDTDESQDAKPEVEPAAAVESVEQGSPVEESDAIPVLEPSAEALQIIAKIIGAETSLVWQLSEVETFKATLTPRGEITTESWSTGDPNEAAAMLVGASSYDGWDVWHINDSRGPSLREALEEINREIREEYESVGAPRKGRRRRTS
ncbi:MAG: hypothetical protein Q4P05_00870 [Actinomycetaceae bacterium]|nr:hypothetical protein [Actinomycetaceae bacterium]